MNKNVDVQYFIEVKMDNYLSVLLTVVSGVSVYILGQLFDEYYLKPIREYTQLKGRVAYVLTYYAQYYSNPFRLSADKSELWENASEELRKVASEVIAFAQTKPVINFFIPRKKVLIRVEEKMIFLSNSCFEHENAQHDAFANIECRNSINKLMKIRN